MVEEMMLMYIMMMKSILVDISRNLQKIAETRTVEKTTKCLTAYLLNPPSSYSVKKLVASPAKTNSISMRKIMLDRLMVTSTFLSLTVETRFEFKAITFSNFNGI